MYIKFMKFFKYNKIIFFLFFYIIIHLFFIKNFPVNFEYSFFNGLKYFDNFNKFYLIQFFNSNANTFGYSFFVGIFYFIFKSENLIYYTRIISATSYVLYLIGLINFFRYYKISYKPSLVIIFFLNPFIWNFGFRGTPDLFSSALAFFSSSFIILNNKIVKNLIFYLLLGIAITIKPHCGLFYIYIFLESLNKEDIVCKKNFYIFFLIFIIPIFYFAYIKYNFNFFLIPPGYYNQHKFNIYNFVDNFFSYFGYSNLAILPFGLIFIKKINFLRKIIFLSIFFFIGFLFLQVNGELDTGPFSVYFKERIFSGILFLFSILILYDFYKLFIDNRKKLKNIIIVIFLFIVILSTTRPAQRYLITIIPLLYILYFVHLKKDLFNQFIFLSLLIYLPVNLFLTINFNLNSKLSYEILNFLKTNNYVNITNPGAVSPHIGYLFTGDKINFKFIIENIPSTKTLKVFRAKILFIDKKLYLNYL